MIEKDIISKFCEDKKHPKFGCSLSVWNFLDCSYNNSLNYFEDYLWKHSSEEDSDFKERVQKGSRYNFVKDVVEQYKAYLFQSNPTRTENSWTKDFWADTGSGIDIDDFMKDVATDLLNLGVVYVVIDKPKQTENLSSKLEEQQLGIKPYSYIVKPQDVEDFEADKKGLVWVKIKECTRDNRDPFSGGETQEKIRLWTRTGWKLFVQNKDKKWVMEEDGLHNLGIVPIVQVGRSNKIEFYQNSLTCEIAKLDQEITNDKSKLQQVISDQTFSQLCIPFSSFEAMVVESVDPYDKMQEVALKLGTKSVIPYKIEDNGQAYPPNFISPDASQGQLILESITKNIYAIYQKAKLLHKLPDGSTSQSGKAKQEDFKELNSELSSIADCLERAEKQMLAILAAWHGIQNVSVDDLVEYPDTFETEVISELVDEISKLELLNMPKTYMQLKKEKLIRLDMPNLTDEEFQKIQTEFENLPGPAGEDANWNNKAFTESV